MANILIRRSARRDLFELWIYVADQSSDDTVADLFIAKIHKAFVTLAGQPYLGRSRDELKEGLRSYAVGSYLIFYIPSEEAIEIVCIVFGGRNLDVLSFEDVVDEDDS